MFMLENPAIHIKLSNYVVLKAYHNIQYFSSVFIVFSLQIFQNMIYSFW